MIFLYGDKTNVLQISKANYFMSPNHPSQSNQAVNTHFARAPVPFPTRQCGGDWFMVSDEVGYHGRAWPRKRVMLSDSPRPPQHRGGHARTGAQKDIRSAPAA